MNRLFALSLLAAACVHSQVVKFDNSAAPPVTPDSVKIYRSTKPDGAFKELGIISFRTQVNNVETIFRRLREDASKQGATAVIDVKINGETHSEPDTITHCMPVTRCNNGQCVTENVCSTTFTTRIVTTYLVVGSMIRSPP